MRKKTLHSQCRHLARGNHEDESQSEDKTPKTNRIYWAFYWQNWFMNKSDLSSLEDRGEVLHGVPTRVPIPDRSEQVQISTEMTESPPQKTLRWKTNFHLGRGPSGLISGRSLSGIGRKFPGPLSLPDSVHRDANKSRSLIPAPLQQLWCSGGKSFTPLLTQWPNLGWNTIP